MPRYPRDHFVDRWIDRLYVIDESEAEELDEDADWARYQAEREARATNLVAVSEVFGEWLARPGVGPMRVLDVVIAFGSEGSAVMGDSSRSARSRCDVIRAAERLYIALLPHGSRLNISFLMLWDTFLHGDWPKAAPISVRKEMERVFRHAAEITTYGQARAGLLYGLSFWGYPVAEEIVERVRTNGRKDDDVEFRADIAIKRIRYGGYSAFLNLPGQGPEQTAVSGET